MEIGTASRSRLVFDAIDKFSILYGLPKDAVADRLVECLRQHFEVFFDATVDVTLSADNIDACYYNGAKTVSINWNLLPRTILSRMRKSFEESLDGSKDEQLYCIWSEHKHTAREGVVIRERPISHTRYPGFGRFASSNEVFVEIDGMVCVMEISQFARHETYRIGDKMFWYILKVVRPCDIYLSRGSRSLPEALLNLYVPEGRFTCIRRIPGTRSVVIGDKHVPHEVIRTVSRELGEVLILRRPKISR